MNETSTKLHEKMHDLKTKFLDTDDLLWEINHKAYKSEPKIMEKIKTDLKNSFDNLALEVNVISKLMKGYIDSEIITEKIAIRFMKFMADKGKSSEAHQSNDISLTEVLDFFDSVGDLREIKIDELKVFKNAEMLNSFLLDKHFEMKEDKAAEEYYSVGDGKESLEESVRTAIGLSNFISSFGKILDKRTLKGKDDSEIKRVMDTEEDDRDSGNIDFELYQLPVSKDEQAELVNDARKVEHNDVVENGVIVDTSVDKHDHAKTIQEKIMQLDSGMNPLHANLLNDDGNIEERGSKEHLDLDDDQHENIDVLPDRQDLVNQHQEQILHDKARFADEQKISYKLDENIKKANQRKMKVITQSPATEISLNDQGEEMTINDSHPIDKEITTELDGSHINTGMEDSLHIDSVSLTDNQSLINHSPLSEHQAQNSVDIQSSVSVDHSPIQTEIHNNSIQLEEHHDNEPSMDTSLNNHSEVTDSVSEVIMDGEADNSPDHYQQKGKLYTKDDVKQMLENTDSYHISREPNAELNMEDDEEDNTKLVAEEQDEKRLKNLEKMGYPKVEQVDLQPYNDMNSFGITKMSLTSSIKKFDGDAEAHTAYKTLNKLMSVPFQEMKEGILNNPEYVPSDNSNYNYNSDSSQQNVSPIHNEEDPQSFDKLVDNYHRSRMLRQIPNSNTVFRRMPVGQDKEPIYNRKSFISNKILRSENKIEPVERKLLGIPMQGRRQKKLSVLRHRTDQIYDDMLKMRF